MGAGLAARADPDGYTLIVVSGSYGANAALHDLPYDSVTGITPIILIGTTPLVLTIHPSLPIKSVSEFIAYSKANPGKLNVASAGVGRFGSELAAQRPEKNYFGIFNLLTITVRVTATLNP